MKLKQKPEDFQVEELTDVSPRAEGQFALYRLEKQGWTTPDALQAVRRRWKLDASRVSYGGLKDRHAHTLQYFSVFHGPQRKLTHFGIHVEYIGRAAEPYTSAAIRANRFRIVVRSLSAGESLAALESLAEVKAQGVPNYFDDQRFGSVGERGEFVARRLILGQYEEALRLALTGAYEHDRKAQKQEKSILLANWRDWASCKAQLPRGHARSLVDYLTSHPTDFRGAIERLRPELRGLYLSAYQSHLWNRLLATWLAENVPPACLISLRLRRGEVPAHRGVPGVTFDALASLRLPLPSARQALESSDPRAVLMGRVLSEEGLEAGQLKLRGLRQMFFSKGERAALCVPSDLEWETADDEFHAGRKKLVLRFQLPSGCYATLIVKRILSAGPPP